MWLDAHSHWPVVARLETTARDLIATMRGRLASGSPVDVYSVDAVDGSLLFEIPPQVGGVRIDGSRSASFERVDVPIVVSIAVVSLAHRVA